MGSAYVHPESEEMARTSRQVKDQPDHDSHSWSAESRQPRIVVSLTHRLQDVEESWRRLEAFGVDTPTQSLDYHKAWLSAFPVAANDQIYITGSVDGSVVALFPLVRKVRYGATIWTWLPGPHVGSNAPVMDRATLVNLPHDSLRALWTEMLKRLPGADAIVLHAMPQFDGDYLFEGLGESIPWDNLYRSEFDSWEECATTQHTRSRRKHDRQQGQKLAAMGEVAFEVIDRNAERSDVEQVLTLMFEQKAKRFQDWGIEDPFAGADIQGFYRDVFCGGGVLRGELHVIRLDGRIVSTRYHLAIGDRIFALISSMDDDPALLPGSPGKQNILRSMQHIFESGYKVCDQGSGYSDEKRHWCNVIVPMRTHYIALTAKGRVAIKGHQLKGRIKHEIKNNERLFNLVKGARSLLGRP